VVILNFQCFLAQKSPIQVRSHGTAIKPSEKTDQSTDFESVLGLDIIPRNRLRVIRRNQPGNQPDDVETLEAAKAAGLVAKQIQNKSIKKSPRLDYEDLEKFDTFSPVYFASGSTTLTSTIKPPRLPAYPGGLSLKSSTGPPPLVASTSTSDEYVPTGTYGVPPVEVSDARPRYQGDPRPPSYGYYPPQQRVMPRVSHMEAECSDDVMKLRVKFNDTFSGLIYSAGYSYDTDCIYINGTGSNDYEFYIQLNRCGTLGGSDHNKKRDAKYKNSEPTKNFMWNTVTIQYNPLIEEEWDEHFKVTCEYGYDFWKTVTFPFLDVEVNTADPVHFTLTPPECHMEIRNGYGTSGTRVTGPVHVGDPLTLLILMRSQWDGFDLLVNDCYAHNGANKRIQLIDHHGCPIDEKLISRFQGTWGMTDNMYDTLIYAHMKTFRFTGTPALYIECDIRMCHGKCPVQSCNWRNPKSKNVIRSKRDLNEEQEAALNKTLSESVSLFQAIHVLQTDEDDVSLKNRTNAELLYDGEESVCLGSTLFAGVIGSLSFVALISSVIVSLLCLKLRRIKDNEATVDDQITNSKDLLTNRNSLSGSSSNRMFNPGSGNNSIDTLRSRVSLKTEYVHSTQARIP